jgi:hypothetical protein
VRCAEIIASATNKHGDLDAWISVGGWLILSRNALDPIDPKRTKVACFDTIPPGPDILKAGKVQVTHWTEVLRLGRGISSSALRDQGREVPGQANYRLRGRRRDSVERRRVTWRSGKSWRTRSVPVFSLPLPLWREARNNVH